MHLLRQVAAGLLAALALVLAWRPAPAPPPAGDHPGVQVVVAGRDLAAGAVLTAADLGLVTLPAGAAPDGVVAVIDRLAGNVLSGPVRRGEPLTDARVVGPGLWSRLPPGQVAAPVRLADLAVAALLRPGDRVDVLATPADARPADARPGDGRPADGRSAQVVAAGALVLGAPPAASPEQALGRADGGLLVLAVSADTAARLAGSATSSTLTVTLGRP